MQFKYEAMKNFLLIPFILLSLAGYSQMNTFGGIGLRVNDTTTYQTNAAAYHTAGYFDIYFNNQATNDHFDIWNGSSYDHVFTFAGSGGGGHVIEEEGTPLAQQTNLNFVGAGVTATDAGGKTVVTVANAAADGSTKGTASFTANDFNATTGNISIDYTNGQVATNSVPGFLSAADHTTFSTNAFIGTQDQFISSAAMWPRFTNGCATLSQTELATSIVNIQTLDFDQTTQEFAQFQVVLPRKYNNGTVTAVFYWTAASGSGTVTWQISGGAYSDDDALTVALGTAQATTDTFITANDVHVTSATSAITLAGTPADADFLVFQIDRNITDTLNADAKLLGVSIRITVDASTD